MTDKRKILEVVEGCNGFYLYHNPSGRAACMADGAGQKFYLPRLDRNVTLMDGEDVFTEAWQCAIDEWEFLEYFEAYFYDLWALEVRLPKWPPAVVQWAVTLDDGVLLIGLEGGHTDTRHGLKDGRFHLVPYTDLSYDEQAAIAEALEEYEEDA